MLFSKLLSKENIDFSKELRDTKVKGRGRRGLHKKRRPGKNLRRLGTKLGTRTRRRRIMVGKYGEKGGELRYFISNVSSKVEIPIRRKIKI